MAGRSDLIIVIDALFNLKLYLYIHLFLPLMVHFIRWTLLQHVSVVKLVESSDLDFLDLEPFVVLDTAKPQLPILQSGTSSSSTSHGFFSAVSSHALLLPVDLQGILGAIHLNVLSVRNMATCACRDSYNIKKLQRIGGERLCSTR